VARELNLLGEHFSADPGRAVERAVDLLGDGILVVDPEGRIVLGNAIAWNRLGWTTPDVDATLRDLAGSSHPLLDLTAAVLHGPDRSRTVPLDEESPGFVAVAHRIEDDGAPAGVLLEIKDRGKHAELHHRIDHGRVMDHLGRMAAGVAHELRGPLQGLEFDLAELESSLDEPGAARPGLRELRDKIQRLEWVVTGFLKVARVQPLRLAPLGADGLVVEVVQSLEAEALMAGVELVVEGDAGVRLRGDRDTLHRALGNLVSNAIEAQPSATGVVTVSVRDRGESVEIAVADAGPGIPEDRREAVFDLYFTTKTTGTGVGLALVRQAVDLHHGEIRIESGPGPGTTLVLTLPSAPPV